MDWPHRHITVLVSISIFNPRQYSTNHLFPSPQQSAIECWAPVIRGFWRRSSAERHLDMLRQHAGGPFIVAVSDQLNVEEAELEGLPDNVVRFRNMPLPEEVAKRAAKLMGSEK
jgi:hypothetical protein